MSGSLTARTADVEARFIDTLTTSDAFGRGPFPGLRVRLIVLAEQLVATVTVRTDVVRVGAQSHDQLFQTSLDVVNTGLLIIGSASIRNQLLGQHGQEGHHVAPKNLQHRLNSTRLPRTGQSVPAQRILKSGGLGHANGHQCRNHVVNDLPTASGGANTFRTPSTYGLYHQAPTAADAIVDP